MEATAAPQLGRLSTAPEISKQLGSISLDRLYGMCREGLIPHVRVGRSILFSEAAIAAWIENGGHTGPDGAE